MTTRTQVNHLRAFHQAKTLAGFHKHSVVRYYKGQNRLGTLCVNLGENILQKQDKREHISFVLSQCWCDALVC